MEPISKIDFVPVENLEQVAGEIRDWILANAFMGLSPGQEHTVMEHTGGNVYLSLGGYVRNPYHPGLEARIEATFGVKYCEAVSGARCEDPEGTWWRLYRLEAHVDWPNYSSTGIKLAKKRVEMIDATMQLAELFDDRFKDTNVWVKSLTRGERQEREADRLKDETRLNVIDAIGRAIHTTCKGMRVGSRMWVEIPDGWVQGAYTVALEKKEYTAYVNAHRQLTFTRIK